MPMLCVFGKRVQQKMGETWFCSNLDRSEEWGSTAYVFR